MGWTRTLFGVAGTTVSTASPDTYGQFFAKSSPWYDVKHPDYGAKGDNSTNDAVAIQAAIDAATAAGGGIVFFPEGIYKFGTSITMKNEVMLLGTGRNASILDYTPATGNGIVTTGVNRCQLRHLGIKSTGASTGKAIAGLGSVGGHIYYDLDISQFTDGMDLWTGVDCKLAYVYVSGKNATTGTGIKLGEAAQAAGTNWLLDSVFAQSYGTGILARNVTGVLMLKPILESVNIGILVESNGVVIIQPYFEVITTNTIKEDGAPYRLLGGSALTAGSGGLSFTANGVNSDIIAGPVEAKGYRTVIQSIANATDVDISFDAESYDYGGDFSLVTGQFTTPHPGDYAVYLQCGYGSAVDQTILSAKIAVDAAVVAHGEVVASGTGRHVASVAYQNRLNKGSVIKGVARQDTGGAVNLETSETRTYMIVAKVR